MPKHERARRLGSPLYCSHWVGKFCLVAGGGGRQSTGLPNRIWCVEFSPKDSGSVVTEFCIKENAPMRMVVPDEGNFALLAMGFGGLMRVDIDLTASPPVFQEYTGLHCQRLREVGEVNCLCLSRTARRLALGLRDGPVQVLEWPSLQLKATLSRDRGKASGRAARDVAFSTSHGQRVLAVVYEDGSCGLWDFYQRLEVAVLELPAELQGGRFSRLVFLPPPFTSFHTAVNARGKGYLVRWDQDRVGDVHAEAYQKVHNASITAMAVSRSGAYLGTGTSDGDTAIFKAANYALVNSKRNGHMVFCTSVAFSSEEKGLLSVSGDATMRTLLITPTSNLQFWVLLVSAIAVVVAALLQVFLTYRS